MFSKFDECTKGFIEQAKAYSMTNYAITKIGTEAFLKVMFDDEDSILRIILDDYGITQMQIDEILSKLVIIRKNDGLYTDKFLDVVHKAEVIALDNDSEFVLEEHLVYALLKEKGTLFQEEIKMMSLSSDKLIEDLKEFFENEDDDIKKYATNLSKLAKENKLNKLIGGKEYLNRMRYILERKNKNNMILIGNAGVGKTALVEGLAQELAEEGSKFKLLSLNLSALVANTKYRGDFEARINKVLNMAINNPNLILFIDEIHMIMGAGQTESSMDAANILKPYLARGDFRCIGATTIDEYNKTLNKDKALARRFQTILINEPSIADAIKIIKGVTPEFSKYHGVKSNDFISEYIVRMATKKIRNRMLPDKAIDLLDEAMVICKKKSACELDVNTVDMALHNLTGVKEGNLNYEFRYDELYSSYLNYALGCNDNLYLLKINYIGSSLGLEQLINEIEIGFGISKEMQLVLNMSDFSNNEGLNTLIGSSPGFVGYEDGGILAEHYAKYPYQIIVIKDFKKASSKVERFIKSIINDGSFHDNKGRTFVTCNTVFIFADEFEDVKSVGFLQQKQKSNDIVIREKVITYENASFLDNLALKGYKVNVDQKEFLAHEIPFKKSLILLTKEYDRGDYSLSYNPNTKEAEIKRVN